MHGREWTWIALKDTNHTLSRSLDNFVRVYFGTIINDDFDPCLVDNSTFSVKEMVKNSKDFNFSYLPNLKLLSEWRKLFYAN
jgi:hypothetical protein